MSYYKGLIERYRSRLPVTDVTEIITLFEGNTPLIPVPNFVKSFGGELELYLKYEGLNPTGAFKDRGMTMAATKAKEKGAKILVCASTGNTSASAAAYACRGNLKCVVLLPQGNVARGKLAQAQMYGATIVQIEGNFDAALNIVRELASVPGVEIVNSINPVRLQGQKTVAFEICEALKRAPDFHLTPVGNAGNITASWIGFKEYFDEGIIRSKPKMLGYQAAGAAPIVEGHVIADPQTIATAIRIGNPATWEGCKTTIAESNGWVDKVTDEEILEAYRQIARLEGIYVEPACAAPLAGLIKSYKQGKIPKGSLITATMTGHGLKDPDIALKAYASDFKVVPATKEAVLAAVGF
jgi:threonine synthase